MKAKLARLAKRWQLLPGIALLAVAGAVTYSVWPTPVPHTREVASASGTVVSTAPWSDHEARTFTADLATRVSVQSEPLVDVSLQGTWQLTPLTNGSAKGALRLMAVLAPTSLRIPTSPESEAALRQALAETVFFDVSEAGLVSGIGYGNGEQPDAVSALSRGLLRSLVAALQVARPEPIGAASWQAAEVDGAGSYQAGYERSGPLTLIKTKQSYAACASCGPSGATTHIVRSRVSLEFTAEPQSVLTLGAVSSDEATRVEGGNPLPDMSSETRLRLRLTSIQAVDQGAVAASEARARSVRFRSLDDRTLDQRGLIAQAKLAGTTFPALVDEIARLDAQGERGSGRRARAFSQLAAHLRFDQSAVADALRRIRAGDTVRDTLIDALGSAGSEAAQAALREIFSAERASESDRQNVVLALSFTPQPSSATIDLLTALQDDPTVGRQSRYGLGTAAYNLNTDEPARAESIVGGLEARLGKASSLQEIMEYLRSLGNAATPSALDSVEKYLSHENASVRAAAVNALRRIPGPRVDQHLATALLRDASPEARLMAAKSMEYRTSAGVLVSALRDSLSGEADRDVRLAAARAALKWAAAQPMLREVLARLAQNDPDKKIREVAAAAS